jgi:hypothetical protein
VFSVEETTYNKIKTNAKLERRPVSIYVALLIENLFNNMDVIKSDISLRDFSK